MNETKEFFHEAIPDLLWSVLQAQGETWDDIKERYQQPPWCGYPGALDGCMGCWSLVGRMVTGEDYCKNCDCYLPKPC